VLEIIYAGGWLMAPIILCSVIALAIIGERFWALRRNNVVPPGVGQQVEDWAARHELDRRHIDQLRSGSALGRVLAAALINRHRSRDLIKEAVEDTGRHVVHELERFLNTLGTIAGISPLLGLLGTVTGMIEVFDVMAVAGSGNAYADEICFAARVHPYRKRTSLTDAEIVRLYEAMQSVLREAIVTLRERVGTDIHREVRDFLAVNGQGGERCPACGGTIAEIKARGRVTNFCRTCQPGGLVQR